MRSIRNHSIARLRPGAAALILALFCAGGLGVSAWAGAQDPAGVCKAQAYYQGVFVVGQDPHLSLTVNTTTCSHAEGTVVVKVSNAAKRKLGISSTTIGKAVLQECGGGVSCDRHLTVPANVRRKLKSDLEKADNRCGNCGHGIRAAGTISITLTGPAGMPHETISAPVKVISIGSSHALSTVFVCTTNVPDCSSFGAGGAH